MGVRKKGRNKIIVNGRAFVWHVRSDEIHVNIASDDKNFVVSYRWFDEPRLIVSGPEFPGISPSEKRPVMLRPPEFNYRSPAALARQVIKWALHSARVLERISD
jgi:hypothetical protein